jgi:hypothetical protein
MDKGEIFAVIWCDFVPLSLPFPNGPAAVECAQQMHARATLAGITLHELRAVRLPPHVEDLEEVLQILWEPGHDVVPA